MTLQLPEPAQVEEARTDDPVYVLLEGELAIEKYTEVSDNVSRLDVH